MAFENQNLNHFIFCIILRGQTTINHRNDLEKKPFSQLLFYNYFNNAYNNSVGGWHTSNSFEWHQVPFKRWFPTRQTFERRWVSTVASLAYAGLLICSLYIYIYILRLHITLSTQSNFMLAEVRVSNDAAYIFGNYKHGLGNQTAHIFVS